MSSRCGESAVDCSPPGNSFMSPPPPVQNNVVDAKIVVVAVAVVFFVVIFILCLHIYAKWFWSNQGRVVYTDGTMHPVAWRRRRRYRGDPRVQHSDGTQTQTTVVQSTGLERRVIEALPNFVYIAEETKQGLECAVCLEEFEQGEKGRALPKCAHSFHLECIDMWLHSHSTCPLCRTSVQSDEDEKEKDSELVAVMVEVRDQLPQTEPATAAAVVSEVSAPFMAAMRASRRRQQSRGQFPAISSPTGGNSLPRTVEDHAGENSVHNENDSAATELPRAADERFSSELQKSSAGVEESAEERSASSIRVPFQVNIDVPRAGGSVGSNLANSASVMSPMARASASFRRLLSRGKGEVAPQSAAEDMEAGGSSSSPRHSPSPPIP